MSDTSTPPARERANACIGMTLDDGWRVIGATPPPGRQPDGVYLTLAKFGEQSKHISLDQFEKDLTP